jgi:hypothetical protein
MFVYERQERNKVVKIGVAKGQVDWDRINLRMLPRLLSKVQIDLKYWAYSQWLNCIEANQHLHSEIKLFHYCSSYFIYSSLVHSNSNFRVLMDLTTNRNRKPLKFCMDRYSKESFQSCIKTYKIRLKKRWMPWFVLTFSGQLVSQRTLSSHS